MLLLTLTSGLATIIAHYREAPAYVYVFKPLTMVLILIQLGLAMSSTPEPYQYWIGAGLVFSLAGDVFLMLPSDRFIQGLLSFLIAHVLYMVGFTYLEGIPTGWTAGVLLVVMGVMLYLLGPNLGKLKIPVIIYMLALLGMAWFASNALHGPYPSAAAYATLGAVLFVASDATLALNRFRQPFAAAQAVVLGTYFLAQWLIAQSV